MQISLSNHNMFNLDINYEDIKYTRLIGTKLYTITLPIQSSTPEVSVIAKLEKISKSNDDTFKLFANAMTIKEYHSPK